MSAMDSELPNVSVADVDRSVQTAIHEKLFSAAACMASVHGEVFHRKVYGCLETPPPMKKVQEGVLFDLASLSKPLGVGLAALWLADMDCPEPAAISPLATRLAWIAPCRTCTACALLPNLGVRLARAWSSLSIFVAADA